MISWIMGCKRAVPSYLMGWTVNGPNNYRLILNQLGPSIKYLYPRLRRSISCILKQNSMPSLLLSRQTDKRKEASGFLPPMHASTQTHLFFLSFCSALQILWDLKFLCVDEKGKQNEGAGGRAGGRGGRMELKCWISRWGRRIRPSIKKATAEMVPHSLIDSNVLIQPVLKSGANSMLQ